MIGGVGCWAEKAVADVRGNRPLDLAWYGYVQWRFGMGGAWHGVAGVLLWGLEHSPRRFSEKIPPDADWAGWWPL